MNLEKMGRAGRPPRAQPSAPQLRHEPESTVCLQAATPVSRLEDPMDRGARRVHGVAEPDTTERLSTQVAPGPEGACSRLTTPSLLGAFAPS